MIQIQDFPTIADFIDHLKQKKNIIGILQYGRRDYQDMSPGGDFDLNIVVDTPISSVLNGLHFHINQIPVDCGIINRADLLSENPPSDYHCVLVDSEILYDPTGEIRPNLDRIRKTWELKVEPPKESELAFDRFIRQHIVDKFAHRLYEDETYSRIFLSGNIFWLLEAFMKMEGLNPYNFKGALAKAKMDYPEIYRLFTAFEATQDLEEKLEITQKLNDVVFAKVGGAWQKDEIIFHYLDEDGKASDEEKRRLVDLIF